jgi:hypothetical protein
MEVTINIGKRVKAVAHANKFQVDLQWMHGDADGDTYGELFFPNTEDGKFRLKCHSLVADHAEAYSYTNNRLQFIINVLTKNGVPQDKAEDIADTISDNFYEGDITSEGNQAALTGFTVTFWDANGVQFEAEVK